MKILNGFFILLLLLSCVKDDSSSNNADGNISIVGTWRLIAWYDDIPRDLNDDGNYSRDLLNQWNGCKKHSAMVLNENRTGEIIYVGTNNNPNCPPGLQTNDFFATGTWTVDEPPVIFTLIGDDYEDPYEIVELSDTTLILAGSAFITCCDPDISYYTGGYLEFVRE